MNDMIDQEAFLASLKVGDSVAIRNRTARWRIFSQGARSWRIYKVEKISQRRHTFTLGCDVDGIITLVVKDRAVSSIKPVTSEMLDEIARVDKAETAYVCLSSLGDVSRQGVNWDLVTLDQADRVRVLCEEMLSIFEAVNGGKP